MNTTYHLSSAGELSLDVINAIKATYKSKSITITIEENESDFELTDAMKAILDQRLQEDASSYITAAESLNKLNKKHGL